MQGEEVGMRLASLVRKVSQLEALARGTAARRIVPCWGGCCGSCDPVDLAYFSGLDLGQAQDFTALAVQEQTRAPDPENPDARARSYPCRHLERFPRGTPYTEIAAGLAGRFAASPLARNPLGVDQTGVGKPVVDLLRRARIAARLRPLTLAGGHGATPDPKGGWLVPKQELVSTLQVLLQSRRLQLAPTLPEVPTLVRELLSFQMKVRLAAPEPLGAWREGAHDDLVLALAIAAWLGERSRFR